MTTVSDQFPTTTTLITLTIDPKTDEVLARTTVTTKQHAIKNALVVAKDRPHQ